MVKVLSLLFMLLFFSCNSVTEETHNKNFEENNISIRTDQPLKITGPSTVWINSTKKYTVSDNQIIDWVVWHILTPDGSWIGDSGIQTNLSYNATFPSQYGLGYYYVRCQVRYSSGSNGFITKKVKVIGI
jgi:hypothetical protein